MNILKSIKDFFMNLIYMKTLEDVTGTNTAVSSSMKNAIELWHSMAQGRAPWHREGVFPCGIEKNITTILASPVAEELKFECRSDFLAETFKKFNRDIYRIIEHFVVFGSSLVRPVFANGKLQYEILPLGNYLPLSYDFDGTLLSCIIIKNLEHGGSSYFLAERHSYAGGSHEVKESLYKMTGDSSCRKVPLSSLPQTEKLTESYVWEDVHHPMIVEFRNRCSNMIDGSNVPVALISGLENLIKDADEEYSRLIWEMESGKNILSVSSDYLRKRQNDDGSLKITPRIQKMLLKLNMDANDGNGISLFSPALRTAQHNEAFQSILKRIEQTAGLGRGALSDLDNSRQTATQFSGNKKTFYNKVDVFESEIETKTTELAKVFAYMARAYLGIPYDDRISISWKDNLRQDPAEERLNAMQEVQQGILNPYEFRERFYFEDEKTAREKIEEGKPKDNLFPGLFDKDDEA